MIIAVGHGDGVQRIGCANLQVDTQCQDRQTESNGNGCAFGCPESGRLLLWTGGFKTFRVIQQAQLQFVPCGLEILLADDATCQVCFQRLQLITVNGRVEFFAGNAV
ncbi:MAG: hypothetical protein NDI87_06160 [Rhodoferax sp.]|nr:hypothetical protein [Rhodoferax sp.]